jgi:hypothetical protein
MAMDLFLSLLGIQIKLLSRKAVPAPLLLDALREEGAPRDAKASARRSSRLKPVPNRTAASNWSALFSEESDLSPLVE